MISTVLDAIPTPPCSQLLGWRVLDARPEDGWIRIGFDGKPKFRNPAGLIQATRRYTRRTPRDPPAFGTVTLPRFAFAGRGNRVRRPIAKDGRSPRAEWRDFVGRFDN